MRQTMKLSINIILYILLLLGLSSGLFAQSSISRDVHIVKGEKSKRGISTVSGDIVIGNNAEVKAAITTVSGDIIIGAKAEVEHVKAVSGDILIGKSARTESLISVSGDIVLYERSDIQGSIKTVSGDIVCATGSDIQGDLNTVSGDIELDDARLRNDLQTVSGDIALFNGSIIEGDIIISRKSNHIGHEMSRLKVVIDMNSVVKGSIKVKEPDTNVIVYLTNGGKVRGEIINAEIRQQ